MLLHRLSRLVRLVLARVGFLSSLSLDFLDSSDAIIAAVVFFEFCSPSLAFVFCLEEPSAGYSLLDQHGLNPTWSCIVELVLAQ